MVVVAVVQEGGKESCEYAAASSSSPVSMTAWIVMAWNGVLEYCAESVLVMGVVERLNGVLQRQGVQKLVEPDEFCLAVGSIALTLVGYYYLMGRRHVRRRKRLAEDLRVARLQVESLQEQLLAEQAKDMQRLQKQKQQQQQQEASSHEGEKQSKNREVRIFMDGAFDMMHYGHMNAFRLARSLGTHLVVGINSDVTITQCKGAPLMNDEERLAMVKGCKFVDEVLPESCPYIMNKEYIDFVISKYNIDYVIHGDDPCIVDGKDVYEAAKKAGKFQSIPRTEGVSTTDIVGRMLLMTKEHHYPSKTDTIISTESDEEDGEHNAKDMDAGSVRSRTLSDAGDARPNRWMVLGHKSKFLTTSHMLRNFSAGVKAPEPHMKIIYIDGAWDMFHCGHVAILEAAKKRGDYLIVGIHGDAVVNRIRGSNLPLMNLHERVLSVLGCRHVDDVLIDAPYDVTPEMVASLKLDEVVRGSQSDDDRHESYRHAYPKHKNMFVVLNSPNDFSMNHILERIKKNQDTFQSKIDRKKRAEESYYQERYYGNNGNSNMNGTTTEPSNGSGSAAAAVSSKSS